MPGAFKSIKELFEGRSGELSDSFDRKYTRKFRVTTNDKSLGPLAVAFAAGIPKLYDPYYAHQLAEYDLYALCRRVHPEQDPVDPRVWLVACEYGTLPASGDAAQGQAADPGGPGGPGGGSGGGASNDPTLEPPSVSWDWQEVERPLEEDLDQKPFLNSAKQPLDPPPTFEGGYRVLTYEHNAASFDPDEQAKYDYAVNQDEFLGYRAGKVLSMPPVGKLQYRGPLAYYRVTRKFKFKPKVGRGTWDVEKFLDQGLMRLENKPGHSLLGQPVPILDGSGQPITSPVPLDGSGQRKAIPANPNDFVPSYNFFRVRERVPFAPLRIALI